MRRIVFILFLSLGGILFAEGIPLSFGGNLGADMSTPMGCQLLLIILPTIYCKFLNLTIFF